MSQTVKTKTMQTIKSRKWQWWSAIIAFIVLLSVMTIYSEESTNDLQIEQQNLAPPLVSVLKISSSNYQAKIEALGEVKPRWQTALRAFVRGEVTKVSKNALEGRYIKHGQELLTIDNTHYLAQLKEAENRLAAAKVSLLLTRRESQQARRNWKLSGLEGQPESPLAFQKPQLEAAEAEYVAAESIVKNATQNLDYTSVIAPFDGVVISRTVNPGETVEIGQPLLTLISHQLLDIPVKLNQNQWQLLETNWQGQTALLHSLDNTMTNNTLKSWPAVLDRASGHIEPDTRQRTLFLKAKVATDLLPGSMVKATIPGRQFQSLLKVPQGTITRDGYIWVIDSQQLLQRSRVELHFTHANWSFITTPDIGEIKNGNANYWQVVATPLASYLPGSKAKPVTTKE